MIRLRAIKSATPLISGSTALADKDAEMLLDPETGAIFIRRKGKLPANVPTQFVVHLSRVDRVEPHDGELEGIFALEELETGFTFEQLQKLEAGEPVVTEAKLVTTAPGFTAKVQMPAPPPATPLEPVKDDEERAIKINGKVEFRRGPMKPDEVAARVQAKKDRAEALLQISEVEWTPEQRKLVEEYTAANPPDAVPTPPAAPTKPTSIAALIASKTAE